jgi:hypothetical protein
MQFLQHEGEMGFLALLVRLKRGRALLRGGKLFPEILHLPRHLCVRGFG